MATLCNACRGLGILIPSDSVTTLSVCHKCSGTGKIGVRHLCSGNHACYLYSDEKKQMRAVVSYITEGLHKNERCIYIADEHTPDEILAALDASGIRAQEECRRGALSVITKQASYLAGGSFQPKNMLLQFKTHLQEALQNGFSGLRGSGEMSWSLDSNIPQKDIVDYEFLAQDYFSKEKPPLTGLCQYNTKRFPASLIQEMSRIHPYVLQD